MLRRILTTLLALMIVGYGTAWAFAGAGADWGAGEDGHGLAALHWTQGDAADPADTCDHGCHASAHLVGLHQQPLALALFGAERPVCVAAVLLVSLLPAPPRKPPRS